MNKLLWISHGGNITEVVASKITVSKLQKFVDVIEVETVKSRPLSFRVIADKFLCKWLGVDYSELRC